MRNEIKTKIDLIIQSVINKHSKGLMILSVIGKSMELVIYFIEKGEIYQYEKKECLEYICNYIYFKYANEMPVAAKNGWIQIFENKSDYDYADNISPYLPYL